MTRGRSGPGLHLRSFAKVNLGLEVLGVREDGFHELRTLFQTIDLHDDVTLAPLPREVTVSCDDTAVPTDGQNLALRAALDLRRYARVEQGVAIAITKRIPVAGGLGGGSSNAAAVLLGLNRLWKLGLDSITLHSLARRLGADVPYFLLGGTALGIARGDEVYPLRNQVQAHVVVVDPGRPVSTAAVFRTLDARLTPRENSHTIFRFVSSDLGEKGAFSLLGNDLERAALEEAPDLEVEVQRIRSVLVREGAFLAQLSGSGSSYFGLFDEARRARRAQAALSAAGLRAYRGRTLSLDQYRRAWERTLGRGGSRGARTR